MITYNKPAQMNAIEAKSAAQRLAFSPIAFQAAASLLRLGILDCVAASGEAGIEPGAVAESLGLPEYGVRVLLDMGLSMALVWQRDNRYVLDKTGHFLLYDALTRVNMDFVNDVCYLPMARLAESVRAGRPMGLSEFGPWDTIYPALPTLPEPVRGSWHRYDHFYSMQAFPDAWEIVSATQPRHILDIGGNTGLWAMFCAGKDPDLRITIVDLPEQLAVAQAKISEAGLEDRISGMPADLLDPDLAFPSGADTIWLSQVLDCFPRAQIVTILARAAEAMDSNASLFILETLWNRQVHEAAAYAVNATSLYFTCIANGTSRMYRSEDFHGMVEEAGLRLDQEVNGLGIGHTLLHCRRN